jgi:L-ascorbate metabolism protein UlaG (beta-lactamase superfamily)
MNNPVKIEIDAFATKMGELTIAFLGHSSLRFRFQDRVWYADPFSRVADFAKQPKADVILVTHHHMDHFDPDAIASVRKEATAIVIPALLAGKLAGGTVMNNGDTRTVAGVKIEAVAAYNRVHRRETGQLYHIPGEGNGYVLTFGEKRIYVAGDTENTAEMKALRDIDIAFLPVNLPYTMTPEMAADAAKAFRPRILYPYHAGDTDLSILADLLKTEREIEVRLRNLA